MTPKEKAKELRDKFLDIKHPHKLGFGVSMYATQAKQCAIVTIDEIIKSQPITKSINYWNEVKQEIEKL